MVYATTIHLPQLTCSRGADTRMTASIFVFGLRIRCKYQLTEALPGTRRVLIQYTRKWTQTNRFGVPVATY